MLLASLVVLSHQAGPALAAGPDQGSGTGLRMIGFSHHPEQVSPVALSADGRYAVYVDHHFNATENVEDGKEIYRYDTATGDRLLIAAASDIPTGRAGSDGDLAISADGAYVAFISASDNLDAKGAEIAVTGPKPSPSGGPSGFPSPSGSPTDAPTPPGTVLPQAYIAHVEDGEVALTRLPLPNGSSHGVGAMDLSADGRRVAFVDSHRDSARWELLDDETAYILDWQTSTEPRQLDLSEAAWNQTGVDQLRLSADGTVLAALIDTGEDTYALRPVIEDVATETKTVGPLRGYGDLALSADGNVVAYTTFERDNGGPSNQGIDTWQWRDSDPVRLPTPADHPYPGSPALSGDGSLVVYQARPASPYESVVYAQARTAATPTLLSRTAQGVPATGSRSPAVSRAGNAVLFSSTSRALPGAEDLDEDAVGFFYLPLTDDNAPTWPNGAVLAVADRDENTLTVSWPHASDDLSVTGYVVFLDGSQIADLPATATSHRLTGISVGDPHQVSVRAVDGSGHRSDPLTAGFYPTGQAPLSAEVTDTGAAQLGWDAPAGQTIQGYRILRADSADSDFATVADLPTGRTAYTDEGLSSATQYRYRVDLLLPDNQTARWTVVQSVQTPVFAAQLIVRTPAGAGPAGGFHIAVAGSGGVALIEQDVAFGVSETTLGPLPADQDVRITADLLDQRQPYALHQHTELTLHAGENTVTFTQQPMPTATVVGTLTGTDDAPIPDSPILLTVRTDDGRDWPTDTVRTGGDGDFTATVLAGYLTVETGARPRESGGDFWTGNVSGESTEPIDLHLADGKHLLNLALATADYGGEYTRQDLDFRTIANFEVTLTDETGADIPIRGNSFTITTFAHELTLCANGWRAGLSSDCRTVAVDPRVRDVDLGVNLTQVGVVTGALVGPDGEAYAGRWQGALTPLDADGNATGATLLIAGYGADLRVGIPAPCTCRLIITAYADTYTAFSPEYRITITAGEADLGAVALVRNPTIGMTSAVTATPQSVQPGQLLSVRAQFTTPKDRSLSSAVVRLGVPVGTTVPAGGVSVDGTPVTGNLVNGYYEVPVGHVDTGATVVVRYALQIGERTTPGTLSALVWVRHDGDVLEPLGTATAQVLGVQLYAPRTVNETSFTIRGTAPAGSLVTVREGANTHAQTRATAGGQWSATIDLGDPIAGVPHTLQASTIHGGATLTSPRVSVTYDGQHPQPTSVTVGQASGRSHTFDPSLGTAVFAFVYWPDEPVQVSATFAATDRLRNVVAHVGQSEAPMTCTATVCSAEVMASNETVGDVWLDYDVATEPYASPNDIDLPSASQLASLLDTPYGALTITAQDGNTFEGTIGGQPFRTTITISDGDAPADWDELTGPIPGWHHTETTMDGDDIQVTEQIAIPTEWLDAVPDLVARGNLNAARALPVFAPAAAGSLFAPASKIVSVTSDLYGIAKPALVDWALGGAQDPWDRLGDLLDVISDSACSSATKKELTDFVTGEGKWVFAAQLGGGVAFTLLGAVAAPATLLGQVLNFGVGLAGDISMGSAADYVVDNAYNQVRRVMDQRDCDYTEPPARPKTVLAHPTYIFDPSGRVYDAVTNQPLAGVTATIQTAPSPDGPWTDWDAAAFGQDNAQSTDALGRYGWFVPVGWWRVTYAKAGYHPATSAVMQVLPEHTDVDIALRPIDEPAPGTDTDSSTDPNDPDQTGTDQTGTDRAGTDPTGEAGAPSASPGPGGTPTTQSPTPPLTRPSATRATTLASTGVPALSLTALAALLILTGAVAVTAGHRRRRPHR